MKNLLVRHVGAIVAASAVLTGAALWALLVAKLGFGHAEAVLVSGLALLCLAQLHLYRERSRASKAVKGELESIMALTHDLLGDVAALRDDVTEMRKRIGERNFLHAEKIANQVEAMEGVVQRFEWAQDERLKTEERIAGQVELLAETVRDRVNATRAARQGEKPEMREDPAGDRSAAGEPAPGRAAAQQTPIAAVRSDLAGRVASAISGNRLDLYLQPIVTLPQRKVRYYEALTRLRDEEGHIIAPGDYLPAAREAGVMTEIDNALLYRSITLVRRLIERRREIGVFCNVASSTLLDSAFFPQFIEFMEVNSKLAPTLIFELSEHAIESMGALEQESLNALGELGFKFSLDHVSNLDIDFERLAGLGFRFVKIDAAVLLDAGSTDAARVHPQDMSKLAQRFNIELIAEKIEGEKTVVNILDYDIRLAQGFLFARPRLVREESPPAPFRAAA
jgi:cyclic-di-GMP phosphodiesterase TipF (flagellum assembly factor)